MVIPKSSYYDEHYRQTAALIRARQPYLIRNLFSGLGVIGFALGIYAFTIKAVAQDDFEDVPVPDAPPQSAHTPHTSVERPVSDAILNQRREAAK